MSLASTTYREAIGARLVPLRDFLLLFFFLDLGAGLAFTDVSRQLFEAGVLSLFVLIGNPLIVLVIMGAMRYPARVSFLAGLTVAQISEFSLILAALGLSVGHIDAATVSLVTVVGLITIGGSTYLILYSHPIYARFEPVLRRFERQRTVEIPVEEAAPVDVILYGLGRYGSAVAHSLVAAGHHVLAADFDPQAVATHGREGMAVVYGDAADPNFVQQLPLATARWLVSTIPDVDVNLTLLHGLRHHGFEGQVALTAHAARAAHQLEAAGADVVLRPFTDAAHLVADVIGRPET